jgi:hypothetical protein
MSTTAGPLDSGSYSLDRCKRIGAWDITVIAKEARRLDGFKVVVLAAS